MSDRRMLCLILALASVCVLAYAHYDQAFGPRLTSRIEEYLGLPHLLIAFGIVVCAVVVLVASLACVSVKEKHRDDD